MSRPPIEEDFFCHVYNRGTEKREIFQNSADYLRFILYLNVLNNKRIRNPSRFDLENFDQNEYEEKERLVNIIAFCLMPNHYHLLLHERTEGGTSKFMQRLGVAYTLYFNEKNSRNGVLFQGKYKYKIVNDESYLLHLINYIHLNPRDLTPTSTLRQLLEFLQTYAWSSYNDFCGDNKYQQLLQTEAVKEFIELPSDYRKNIMDMYAEDGSGALIHQLLLD